jgi:hypothetical protein
VHGTAREVAVIDAKAYREYGLPVDDVNSMAVNYLSNFRELTDGSGDLAWCGYVAGGYTQGFEARAARLSAQVNVPVSSVSAAFLLDFASSRGPSDADKSFAELRGIGHKDR